MDLEGLADNFLRLLLGSRKLILLLLTIKGGEKILRG